MALVSGGIFTGFIQNLRLYETSEYLAGHLRHLLEANTTNIMDPPFDEVSTSIVMFVLPYSRRNVCSFVILKLKAYLLRQKMGPISWFH